MITLFELWLILRLDAISSCLGGLAVMFGFIAVTAFIITLVGCFIGDGEDERKLFKKCFIGSTVFVFLVFGILVPAAVLIPTTKQAAIIYAVPKILTEKNVVEFTGETKELYNLGKQYLKEALTKKEEEK
jgi:hypothetical protein